MLGLVRPKPLKPGDVVRVVAPATNFDRTLFFRGLDWLSRSFRVRFEPDITKRDGAFAGTDGRRLQELNRALSCPDAAAVVTARGGYGCTRIIDAVDFAAALKAPKWLVGFSDVTALHLRLQRLGLRSLHAHNVTGLGVGDSEERQRWLAALTGEPSAHAYDLETLYPGRAAGILVGGNLSLLAVSVQMGARELPEGAVLFLEDVGELPYRVDRLLIRLEDLGVFDRVSAVVTGYFTSPSSQADAMRDVLRRQARRVRVPWLHGLAVGHERPNHPLELGAWGTVTAGRFTWM